MFRGLFTCRSRWCATLEDLVPVYLDAVPDDPFTVQPAPLQYRVDEAANEIVIWGVGSDQVDDNGSRYDEFGSDYIEGTDIVFDMPIAVE